MGTRSRDQNYASPLGVHRPYPRAIFPYHHSAVIVPHQRMGILHPMKLILHRRCELSDFAVSIDEAFSLICVMWTYICGAQ
jgi:hypothetical protein